MDKEPAKPAKEKNQTRYKLVSNGNVIIKGAVFDGENNRYVYNDGEVKNYRPGDNFEGKDDGYNWTVKNDDDYDGDELGGSKKNTDVLKNHQKKHPNDHPRHPKNNQKIKKIIQDIKKV